jgi:hypothetical protein
VLDAFRELIDELLNAPRALRAADIDGDDPETRSALALVTDRDAALIDRIQKTIRQTTPVLKAPPDQPSPAAVEGSAADLMSRFETMRGELVSLLMNLTLRDWERVAIDWNGRELSVADDVEHHVEFDEEIQEQLTGSR